jgi:hypothetical protein
VSDYTEFLTTGAVLPLTNNRSAIIGTEIGNGFTAYVYKAQLKSAVGEPQPVIVKLAKPTAIAAKLVKEEGDLLTALAETGKSYAPVLYATGDYHGQPFLVMELIAAAPAFVGSEGSLGVREELSCLKVMKEVYTFLGLLHGKLRRAYPDMKPDNFFWDENANRLRVIDFGGLSSLVLSADEDLRAQSDVMVASTFFFTALSGSRLRVGWNGLEDFAEPRIDQLDVSRGTRNLLRKLLCREVTFRLHSAALAADGVEALINLWNWEGERLTQSIQRNLELARQRQDTDPSATSQAAERALEALDLYRRRFGSTQEGGIIASLFEQAQALSLSSSQLETGKKFLGTRNVDLARKAFTEGKARSSTPGVFRRWLYLTSVIEASPEGEAPALIDSAATLFQCIDQQDFKTAVDEFTRMQQTAPEMPGYQYLLADAKFFWLYHQAGQAKTEQDYRSAAGLLQQALEQLTQLPDQEEIKQLECGDVDNEVTRLLQAAEKQERMSVLLEEATTALDGVEHGSVLEAYATLRQVSQRNWDNPAVFKKFYDLFTLRVEQAKYAEAACLLGFLQDFAVADQSALAQLAGAREFISGLHGLQTHNGVALRRALQNLLAARDAAGSRYAKLLLQELVSKRAYWPGKELLAYVAALPKEVQPAGLESFVAQAAAEEQRSQTQMLEGVVQKIKAQLFFTESDRIDWPTAEALLRSHSVRDLITILQNDRQQEQSAIDMLENAAAAFDLPESTLAQMRALQQKLEQKMQAQEQRQASLASVPEAPASVISTLKTQLAGMEPLLNTQADGGANFARALTVLDGILAALIKYGSTPELTALYVSALQQIDGVGLEGWRLLQARQQADQSRFDAEIKRITEVFEKGGSEQAYQELVKIEPLAQIGSAAVELRKKIITARMLETLAAQHTETIAARSYDADLLASLRALGEVHIPAGYYARLDIVNYLNAIIAMQRQFVEARRTITATGTWLTANNFELEEYRSAIEKWLDADTTLNKVGR